VTIVDKTAEPADVFAAPLAGHDNEAAGGEGE
jgi:hypothetical protein